MKKLSFIHAVVDRASLACQWIAGREGCDPHLYFESNFNGGWEEYRRLS
jgi:hypothetical protein